MFEQLSYVLSHLSSDFLTVIINSFTRGDYYYIGWYIVLMPLFKRLIYIFIKIFR